MNKIPVNSIEEFDRLMSKYLPDVTDGYYQAMREVVICNEPLTNVVYTSELNHMTLHKYVYKLKLAILTEQYIAALRKYVIPTHDESGETFLLPLYVVLGRILHTLDGYGTRTFMYMSDSVSEALKEDSMNLWYIKLRTKESFDVGAYNAEMQSALTSLADYLDNQSFKVVKNVYDTENTYTIEVAE